MKPPSRPRLRQRALGFLAAIAATAAAPVALTALGGSPAQAAGCATEGHAYLTQPGRVIFSGYNGDQRFGVPTLTVTPNTYSFRLGGNGILPYTGIRFQAVDRNSGAIVGLDTLTSLAGGNCVVNESSPITPPLPPGNYRIQAIYIPGNGGGSVIDHVANLDVQPYVPPPPYDPYDPYDPSYPSDLLYS